MSPMPRRARAFTLIELLMAIAILAVLCSLGVPAFGSLAGRAHGRNARTELVTALNQARLAAVMQRARTSACPSRDQQQCVRTTEWHHGWIVFADRDRDGLRSAGEPLLAINQGQPGGVAILSTAGRLHVDYRPDGSVGGTNLTLTVCDRQAGAAEARAVVVNQAGRVRQGTASPAAAEGCLRAAAARGGEA